MMKVVKNWADAICLECEKNNGIELNDHGQIVCAFCCSEGIVGHNGKPFVPIWVTSSRNDSRKRWGKPGAERRLRDQLHN